MNSKILIAIIAMFLIASCKVGRKYQQPALELPAQFQQEENNDTISMGELQWKEFFTDPTLQKLIDTAIVYNHDLLVAVNRIQIAQRRLSQSKLLQLPAIDLQLTAQYNRPSENSLNGISINSFLKKSHVENYSTVVNVSWEADIWGRLRGLKEAAAADYLQSAEAARAIQTQLVADVAQGYFNLLMLDRQLDIARRNLALSDSFLLATRMLRDAGVVTQLAVEQAYSQKGTTAALIPQLEEEIALQENNIRLLTGKLPSAINRNTGIADKLLSTELQTGLPAAVVARRPDVRSAEMALVATNARVGVAKANMYPALNITAGAGLESFKASNWFNMPASLFGIAAGSIVQPIFRRGALKAEYDIATLEREAAVTRFRQQVLIAVTEVENALIQIKRLEERQRIAEDVVDTLNMASRNARLLFGSDMATYLEVVTAQGNSLQAQLELSAIRRNALRARVELYRALGGGWK